MRINKLVYITTLIVDIKAVEKSIINLENTGGISWWNLNFYSGLCFPKSQEWAAILTLYAINQREKNIKYIAIESLHCNTLKHHAHRMYSNKNIWWIRE